MHMEPIGVIHTPFKEATGTPIQPVRAVGQLGTIELDPKWVEGLADLDGFDRIWLIYYFNRALPPQMKVIPYRDVVPRGIFATRVPPRPNHIGMSCVKLVKIEGNILHLADVDILDGTPLLDIKPYVPEYDNYPVERCGWIDTAPKKHVVADDRFEKRSCCGGGQ